MKTNDELKDTPRLTIFDTDDVGGGCGTIHMYKWTGSVIWSRSEGWDHVSVSPYKKRYTPSWDDMCKIKEMFFKDDETVMQMHPAKSDYVNVMNNCLHLWRPTEEKLPVPPKIFV